MPSLYDFWIRLRGTLLLMVVGVEGIACMSLCDGASKALGMHDYKYYDFLDYTAWDFATYEKPKRKAFKGYLANGFSDKQQACLYFFPKTLVPKFDKTKLISLEKAQERIQRINAQTLGQQKKEPETLPAASPEPIQPTIPAQKRIVSQAGGSPALAVRGIQEEKGATPLTLKSIDPTSSLSPEDILLFLKKKLPPGHNEASTAEVVVPFHVPLGNAQNPILYPSQALYTQE